MRKEIRVPKKGMNRNTHPSELKEGEYSFAMNANIQDEHSDGDFILTNENSNIKCSGFKEGYFVIGHKYDLNNDRTYFFLVNPETGCSEIGYIGTLKQAPDLEALEKECECNFSVILEEGLENTIQTDTCAYTTLVSDCDSECSQCLNFDMNFPIHQEDIVIRYGVLGTELYFDAKNNPPRYLQVDKLEIYTQDVDDCTGVVTETCLQCDKMRVFPKHEIPCLTPVTLQNGGNLKAGTIEVLIAYSDLAGNVVSDWYSKTNPISLHDASNNILDQTTLDYNTNKSVLIGIDGLDQSFEYFKIAVIYNSGLDQSTTIYEYGVYPINYTQVVITDLENKQRISLQEIISRRTVYETSGGLASAGGHLFHFDLTAHREINLQPIANLLGAFVQWGTVKGNENLYLNGINTANYKGFMRDETYPLSIKFLEDGGYELANITLIARPPKDDEMDVLGSAGFPNNLNTDSVMSLEECVRDERQFRWQFENTATNEGECYIPGSEGEVIEKTIQATCEVEVEELEAGQLVLEVESTLQNYINTHKQEIIDSTDPQWAEIGDALEASYPETCSPEFGDNCSETVVSVLKEIYVSEVINEQQQLSSIPFSEYERVYPPENCNTLVLDEDGDPVPDSDATPVIRPGDIVYEKITPVNTDCATAIEPDIFASAAPSNTYHLVDKYALTSFSSLQTSKDVSLTSSVFTSKLHTNAVWFKVPFESAESRVFEISPNVCNTADDNTGTSVRISVFDTCGATEDIATYGRIVADTTLANDSNKFIVLQAEDFSTGFAYIAIDSPIKAEESITLSFSGTSGNSTVNVGITPYLSTFNTNAATTASDFSTAYAASLASLYNIQIISTVGNTITLRGDKTLIDGITISPGTPNLSIVKNTVENYYTLTPPCGCFSAFKRDTQLQPTITYDGIVFSKRETFESQCTFTLPLGLDCEPTPFQYGDFSYTESQFKYPCNPELYDSRSLLIRPTDLPLEIRDKFEEYFTTGTPGTYYQLSSEANLMDKPIRHYKFPSNQVSPFMSINDNDGVGASEIFPIGFIINNDIINAFLDIAVNNNLLSLEERQRIKKYEVFRGDRRTQRSVIAKGLLFDMYEYYDQSSNNYAYYPNYPLNHLGTDYRNGGVEHPYLGLKNNMFTFHSPEVHFRRPTLPNEISFDGYQMGKSLNYFNEMRGHSEYVILGRKALNLANLLAIAEISLEFLLQSSNFLINGAAGGLSAPASTAIAVAAVAAMGVSIFFKKGRYEYQWIQTFESLGQLHNYASYQLSIGQYNRLLQNDVADSQYRSIAAISYLREGRTQIKDETNYENININNFKRETSVIVRLKDGFEVNYPSEYVNYDNGFFTNTSRPFIAGEPYSGEIEGNAASPYVALKQYLPNQYGQIGSVDWVSTGYCGNLSEENNCQPIFGGDTFISRFSLLRKFAFFTATAYGLAPNVPFKYSRYINVSKENFGYRTYLDFKTGNSELTAGLFTLPKVVTDYNLESEGVFSNDINDFYVQPKWRFLVNSFGIPYFLVESEINCNYRYGKPEPHEDFYPNVGDAVEWVQEDTRPISEPNTYFYNDVYSKYPTKYPNRFLPESYTKEDFDKFNDLSNAVIYSVKDNFENSLRSPWLNYKALDFSKFPKSFGNLTAIDDIESEQLLARFTNGMAVLGSVDPLRDKLTVDNNILGIGGIFNERSVNFNKTDLGSAGSQHRTLISCDFGHFWADAKRGKVFGLAPNASGLKEISATMDKWFKEHLPFRILRDFPEIDIDNNYKGLGISMGWDDRFKRLFLTKLDYQLIKSLNYSPEIGFYTGTGNCPEGYTLIDGQCVRETTLEKVPTGEPISVINAGANPHGFAAPVLYSEFNADGSANVDVMSPTGFTYIDLPATFWRGDGVLADRLTTKFGKWVSGSSVNVWYGASSIIDVETTTTYYVALAADNLFRFKVDGVVIVESDPETMGVQHGLPLPQQSSITFRKVHIYPIELTAGCHIITIEGLNEGGSAMFGAAIIDNTLGEIVEATSYEDIDFLYSTETETVFYQETVAFTCPEDSLALGPGICDDCLLTEYAEPDYIEVELGDPEYFSDRSWTVGYSPLTESWISYYSFLPNYYVGYNDYFQTGINSSGADNGLWSHFPFISSYQVFYGARYPFIVEHSTGSKYNNFLLSNIEYWLQVRKYYDRYNFADVYGKGAFNKAVIYNDYQNTGLLNLVFNKKEDLRQNLLYPIHNLNSIDILQSEMNGKWNFNYLYNTIKKETGGLPTWKWDNNQIFKSLNNKLLDYRPAYKDRMRGDYFLIRMIQDKESRFKMLYRFIQDSRLYYEQ